MTPKGVKLAPARRAQPAALLEERIAEEHQTYAVGFDYFNPNAREVMIAGSFNAWQPGATPMTKKSGGSWSTQLLLKPGQYEYRLIVDGQWQDDPMAARFIANPFGGLNSVVEVKPAATPVAPRF